MPRARRQWSTMRAEIRRLLRETVAADSFWSDQLLLDLFNHCMDLRASQMMSFDEGWFTDRLETDIVANQREYTVPEGSDRIKRILISRTVGNTIQEFPLYRDEMWFKPLHSTNSASAGGYGGLPTVRFQGELLYLEPPPTESITDGLIIEMEALPDRLTVDGSKLDLKFPAITETLLEYDVWDAAMGVEDAQGNVDASVRGRLQRFHQKYESAWLELVSDRFESPFTAQPWYLGD